MKDINFQERTIDINNAIGIYREGQYIKDPKTKLVKEKYYYLISVLNSFKSDISKRKN